MKVHLDHRVHPRYLSTEEISIKIKELTDLYKLIDFSYGGISFISESPQDYEQIIQLELNDEIKLDLLVVNCVLHKIEEDKPQAVYKVCCRYLNPIDNKIWENLKERFTI